jgi:predicted alpha-1,2-mannosidase
VTRTHLTWRGRSLRTAVLTVVALLAAAIAAAPVGAAGLTRRPSLYRGSTTHLGVCTKAPSGRLQHCPRPVPTSQFPAAARSQALVTAPVQASDLASLVDTRTWTSGGGNTFPGATAPFGMVQWSPDTLPNRSAGGGYSYGDATLDGYSLTHVSGPGCGAAGDVPILPITGALPSGDPNNVTTPFSNTGEIAQAGYYSAQSNQPATITSEFTATPHSSMGQFSFPQTSQAGLLVKLMDSQNGDSADTAQVVGNNEVTGSVTSGNFCGETNNGGQPQQYTVYFDITFNHPFTTSKVITNAGQSRPAAVLLNFDATSTPVIDAKVGISYVSTANAKLNWQTENPGWDFGAVKSSTQQSWDSLLSKISVSGGTTSRTQEFYSLLYKDLLQPNITSDVNGQFMGSDFKMHTLATGQKDQYGIFSGWDTFHSLAQLQAIVDPSVAGDQAQSLLNYYDENGLLQQWGYLHLDNYVMVGDPAQSIIADYYAFGAHNFNTGQALTDMLKQANTVNDVRPGQALEQKYGYLPENGSYGCCNPHGYVPTLLEYDSQDLALSHFVAALGDTKDAAMLEQRANNWQNVFDPAGNLLTPRNQDGSFVSGITPTTTDHYVEGDAYEYLWNTPNNYSTLFSLLGGNTAVAPALRKYLSQPNGFGMFAQLSNEFDFGEQYALDYAGDPAGTQDAVNTMRDTMYPPGPSGLPNNDDLGANSSSFIWSMLGMYPENSGFDTLVFATPGFPHATVSLPNGKTITIDAPGASSTNHYVDSLKLNGSPYNNLYVNYSTLTQGATLQWTVGSKPTTWGSAPRNAPPSYTAGTHPFVGFLPVQHVTISPGASTTVEVGAQNATAQPQVANVSVSPPSPLTVQPTSGSIRVPPNGRQTISLTVQAPSSTPQTDYSVPIHVGSQTLNLTVLVAQPGSLLTAYNNAGISNDSDAAAAAFDSNGNSYSAQALAGQGLTAGQTKTFDGVTFTWPSPAPGFPDNAVASGQDVTVNAPAGTQKLGFLGSATNGPSQGVATLRYTDGSTQRYWLGLSDWTLNAGNAKPSFGNQIVATTSYRNCPGCTGGRDSVATSIFYAALPVDASKTLKSVTLPSGADRGQLHIFAIGTSTQPMSGPVALSLNPSTAGAGQKVTINGSGFGASQGAGYVTLIDGGTTWGAPGGANALQIDSWSDTAITLTVPTPSGTNGSTHVNPGTDAAVQVVSAAGHGSDTADLQITPSANLADYYDNAGITPDNNQGCAQLDGVGFSYSADALAKQGLTPGASVTADGLSFTWPNLPACSADNILAAGQTILVNGKSGAKTLGLLGSSTNGSSSGTITINYTDGTSTTQTVFFDDWASSPGSSDTAVATMPYRNSVGGSSQSLTVYVFATTVPVDSTKTVQSATLPDVSNSVGSGVTAMHIFTLSLG